MERIKINLAKNAKGLSEPLNLPYNHGVNLHDIVTGIKGKIKRIWKIKEQSISKV